jgi:hypothetical protein
MRMQVDGVNRDAGPGTVDAPISLDAYMASTAAASHPPPGRATEGLLAWTPRPRECTRARTGGKCTMHYSRRDQLAPVIFVAAGDEQSSNISGGCWLGCLGQPVFEARCADACTVARQER